MFSTGYIAKVVVSDCKAIAQCEFLPSYSNKLRLLPSRCQRNVFEEALRIRGGCFSCFFVMPHFGHPANRGV